MESHLPEESDCDESRLEEIVEHDAIITSDELQTLIVVLNQRNGADIEAFLDSEEELNDFIELLNDLGLQCFVLRDPGQTAVESFAALFSEEDMETPGFSELMQRDLKARIYITKDGSYDITFFERMENDGSYGSGYHREMGEFYGYPQEDIEAFVYEQSARWKKFFIRLIGRGKKTLSKEQAFEKYGSKGQEERRMFTSFISHILADTENAFEKNMRRARAIKKELERTGIGSQEYIDDMEI
jgi:hypothetical protein